MRRGERVSTPRGPGAVAYTRNGPPDYTTPVTVSVVLDARRTDPNYTGTIFHASDVWSWPEPEPELWFYGAPVLDVGENYILFACGCSWWGALFGERSLCERHRKGAR